MPTTHENYTLNIQPVDDHLEVFVPELGMKVTTTSTSREEAIDAAHRAIAECLPKMRESQAKVS